MKSMLLFVPLWICLLSCDQSRFSGGSPTISDPAGPAMNESPGDADDPDASTSNPNRGIDDETDVSTAPPPTRSRARFGLLINNPGCAFCHLEVNGDVVTVGNLEQGMQIVPMPSNSSVNGDWFIEGTIQNQMQIPNMPGFFSIKDIVRGVAEENSNNDALPLDVDNDGRRDFPEFDKIKTNGSLVGVDDKGTKVVIKGQAAKDVILIGTKSKPIKLGGDVYLDGSLIIAGWFQGVGNIYASGAIFIPANLKAVKTAFPMPKTKEKAKEHAAGTMKNTDGLGLATKSAIIIGGIDSARSMFGFVTKTDHSGSVFPNLFISEDRYYGLHDSNPKVCSMGGVGAVTHIDAFLYAKQEIAGHIQGGNYTINGGVITPLLNLLGSGQCGKMNQINYDYRVYMGMPLLGQLEPYFKKIK